VSIISSKDRVVIFGGAGFLGTYLVKELAKTHAKIIIVSRGRDSNNIVKICGSVGQISFAKLDSNDHKSVKKVIKGATHVINLIGIMFESKNNTFTDAHVKMPMVIGRACLEEGVKSLIHISALGVNRVSESKYASTKVEGEKILLQSFPNATIIRPSAIFGAGDNFTNLFNKISKISPFIPMIGGGYTKMQPLYVGDLAKALLQILSIDQEYSAGKIFEFGGPKVLTLRSIVAKILEVSKRKRGYLYIPFFFAKYGATILKLFNSRLLTLDQVQLLQYDNILYGESGFKVLGVKPTPLEAVLPTYIN
jgi:uncharacterized protein YbjT (DUF2867 family)